MRILYILFACTCIMLTACNNTTTKIAETTTTTTAPKVQPQSKLSGDGTNLLMNVVSKYYTLKDALVATNATKADTAARELNAASDSLNAFLSAHNSKDNATTLNDVLHPFVDTITKQSATIPGMDDKKCEQQRMAFGTISSAMFGLLKAANLEHAGVYHEFCPMAFNEKGAYWLSDESEIKNPYFGKKMIECGEVTDSLK